MVVRAIGMLAVPGLGPPNPRPVVGQRDSRMHKITRSQSRVPTVSFFTHSTTATIASKNRHHKHKKDVKTKQHGAQMLSQQHRGDRPHTGDQGSATHWRSSGSELECWHSSIKVVGSVAAITTDQNNINKSDTMTFNAAESSISTCLPPCHRRQIDR